MWTENIYINSSLDQADLNAAVLFSEYLISTESQTILASIGLVPVRKNLMDAPKLMTQAFIALSNNNPYPPDSVLSVYLQAFNDILKDVYEYRLSPQDALQTASEQIANASKDFKTMEDDF